MTAGQYVLTLDMNGKETIGWLHSDNGWLALDRDGSGRIDSIDEISFVDDLEGARTDLEGLLAYDTDGDGFLTAADERFGDFFVWRDLNGNGKSEKKELFTLEELGIEALDLYRTPTSQTLDGATDNVILNTSRVLFSNGEETELADVALAYAPGNNRNGDKHDLRFVDGEAFADLLGVPGDYTDPVADLLAA